MMKRVHTKKEEKVLDKKNAVKHVKKNTANKNVSEKKMLPEKKKGLVKKVMGKILKHITPGKSADKKSSDKNAKNSLRDVASSALEKNDKSDTTSGKSSEQSSDKSSDQTDKPQKIEQGDPSEYDIIDMSERKPRPKNNKLRLLLIILFVIIIGVAITITYFYSTKILVYREVNMSVTITPDGNAFDTDTDMLDFAKSHPGGKSTKMITVNTKQDAIVHLESTGNISKFISYSENDFILNKGASREIKIALEIPDNTPLGDYEGKLKVYFYRP